MLSSCMNVLLLSNDVFLTCGLRARTVVDRSRSAVCWFLHISQESQDDCLHVDFECFKSELWPTLRQKFMNFWSFLTRPGDKHDADKISNCSSTPRRRWYKLTILPWVSGCFNFPHDKTPNLMVFNEISFRNEMFRCSIKRKCLLLLNRKWFSSCKHLESQAARDFATVLRDNCRPYVLQRRRNELKYTFNCQNHACFPRIYLSILHK